MLYEVITQRVEHAEHVHAVLGRLVNKGFDHVIGIMAVAQQVLATQQLIRTKTGYEYTPLETSDLFPSLGVSYNFV